MINAVLVMNTQGKPRLTKFYQPLPAEKQQEIVKRVYSVLSSRAETFCSFVEADEIFGPDTQLVYKHFATLYFVFVIDSSESELGILDLIQVFVETLNSIFKDVCELDIVYNFNKMAAILNGVTQQPLFSFGIITDIQYANISDGRSFWGTPRYYRHSLEALHGAVNSWNKQRGLSFVIQLGDIVDGNCPKEESRAAVLKVLSELDQFKGGPVYHILGNHCLYNLSRNQLNELLKIPTCEDGRSYYWFSPADGYRIVVLDGYDVSMLGWPEDHPHAKEAVKILQEMNTNEDKNSPAGLDESHERYVKFNGGIGKDQLLWLNMLLKEANENEEKVIICCHIPLYRDATYPDTLVWNCEEVMDVIHRYKCVKACFAGHKHTGGYAVDEHDIHHRVVEAVLECPPGENAFGHVDVYNDRISLVGQGRLVSQEMHIS